MNQVEDSSAVVERPGFSALEDSGNGSVHFVAEGINPTIRINIGSKDDGETTVLVRN